MTSLATGRNGENPTRAEGATRREAWAAAIKQERQVGMLKSAEPRHGAALVISWGGQVVHPVSRLSS